MALPRLRLPNLLATRKGRLAAFFCLYVTEGIPLGFAATAVAAQLRRDGVGPAEIGAFVALLYIPWGFKWIAGPIVDVFAIERLGRRRGWILITQVLMALTLLSTALLKLPEQLWLFSAIIVIHNLFGATQDVAIDALACTTLEAEERGVANGMMFAGAYFGNMLGGAGVLFLSGYTGFQTTFLVVAGLILLVTVGIVLPMREPPSPPRPPTEGSKAAAAFREVHQFATDSFRSFLGTRGALAGVLVSLLPPGAMCLGLSLLSNLGVELGMSDEGVASLSLTTTITSAVCCVLGGALSDRFGRRLMLSVYIALMSLPVLYLMVTFSNAGWIFPVDMTAADRPVAPPGLLGSFWFAAVAFAACNGLMYGTRSAIMMDVTNPAVAGTQFTAYMALANVAIAFASTWQGIAVETWGYPRMMLIDALFGLCCLALIPLLRSPRPAAGGTPCYLDGVAPRRARLAALVLGTLCLLWVPAWIFRVELGAFQKIAGTLGTLIFIASAVFLLAGGAVIAARARGLALLGACWAPLLILPFARYYADSIAGLVGVAADSPAFLRVVDAVVLGGPAVGGLLLLVMAARPWRELEPSVA